MKGDPDVIEGLRELLIDELTSADMYLYFARRLAKLGYGKLEAHMTHEAEHETLHATMVIDRIVLLGGDPDVLKRRDKDTPRTPKGMLEVSLAYEIEVAASLNTLIALCDERGDAGTRQMLDVLLRDTEEDHIDWLETQLHQIGELGLERYLAEQVGPPPA